MRQNGFTLMELLVVLLIIGILSTVALRTIDATRDRALFDQTAKELSQLVQAMTGNPDLSYDGRRTDFGYFGDFGALPGDLRELVTNMHHDSRWHGPYIRTALAGDTESYLIDGWGHPYTYNPGSGTISSLGNGKFPISVKVADSLPQLSENSISGSLTDRDNNPPGDRAPTIAVWLRTSYGDTSYKVPDASGYYSFQHVKIGSHRVVALIPGGDSISRWVTIVPRSNVVLDMRYSKTFRNRLSMIGAPVVVGDSDAFLFEVVNEGTTDDTVSSLVFASAPDSVYMNLLQVDNLPADTVVPPYHYGLPPVTFSPYIVPANRAEVLRFMLAAFTDSSGSVKRNIHGDRFRIRFSEGSEITVTP